MKIRKFLKKLVSAREFGIAVVVIAICVLIGSVNPVFYKLNNIMNVLRSTCSVFIIALAATFVMIAAGLDLSVGSVCALGGIVSGYLVVSGLPTWICILGGILAGATVGAINGSLIVLAKMPPMIVTLGTTFSIAGLVIGVTNGAPIMNLTDEFCYIGQNYIGPFPILVVFAAVIAVIAHVVLTKTPFGRGIFAIGGNEEVARLAGIPVNSYKLISYIFTGIMSATSGIFLASRLGSAQTSAGASYQMTVIASVIIGGTSLFGGSGSILGTFLGCFLMTVINTGMVLMKISAYWQDFILGIIIILAVFMDQSRRKKLGLR